MVWTTEIYQRDQVVRLGLESDVSAGIEVDRH
jgi:hypothetical protein